MPLPQRIYTAASTGFPDLRHCSDPVEQAKRIDRIRSVCSSHRTAGSAATPAKDAPLSGPNTIEKTSCSYRDQTFFGDFCVSGSGPDTIVSVHHNGHELEAKVGSASIEAAAEALLQEMVMRELISTVVANH